ncbi:peter Pan-like protein [Pyrus ussuriensis x Pyrus communis]|uniref:Peter Pan-like protein n=1 Tax=Pyrus ussuriensis x Pyrus communis TaxID=2448454 RepID=A0A5N5FKI1_9ROSA|nr:peter Pan-like protein [Pyrus ussuriensis x Pyrus communis]
MAGFKNLSLKFLGSKKKVFVKSVSMKKQANIDHITGDKIPRSFVFSRCNLPGLLKQLQADLRKLMLRYTALKLKEKRRNNLKDFLTLAGPIGVTHFLMLSKTPTVPYLRFARTPQGSTLFLYDMQWVPFVMSLWVFTEMRLTVLQGHSLKFWFQVVERRLFILSQNKLSSQLQFHIILYTLYAIDREWIRN